MASIAITHSLALRRRTSSLTYLHHGEPPSLDLLLYSHHVSQKMKMRNRRSIRPRSGRESGAPKAPEPSVGLGFRVRVSVRVSHGMNTSCVGIFAYLLKKSSFGMADFSSVPNNSPHDEWCPARGVVVVVNVRGTRGDHLECRVTKLKYVMHELTMTMMNLPLYQHLYLSRRRGRCLCRQ